MSTELKYPVITMDVFDFTERILAIKETMLKLHRLLVMASRLAGLKFVPIGHGVD